MLQEVFFFFLTLSNFLVPNLCILHFSQKEDLKRVMDLLSLKEHHARTLLIHYLWDTERVFAVFVEKGKERLYVEAGLSGQISENLSSSQSSSEVTCEICFDEVPSKESTTMDCGHCYCNNCKNLI